MKEGQFAYPEIDDLFHSPTRLRIATALRVHSRGLTFGELKELCSLTDGNLSRHLRKLEEEKVIRIEKEFVGKVPQTTAIMTDDGVARFQAYLHTIESVISAVENRTLTDPTPGLWLSDA
jgi:DNA-binding transcriptional ArsR family regulator